MRLLVADGHELTRAGIRQALAGEEGFEVVGEAGWGPKLLPCIAETRPDVVLLDLDLPGIDVPTYLMRIRERNASVCVIGMAASANLEQVHIACSKGASGAILKTIAPSDLAGAIRQIVNGTTFTALGGPPLAHDSLGGAGLTKREQVIVEALARGLSNKQIAKELFVTEQTVKYHLTNIYRKLELPNRMAAVRWAYSHGLAKDFSPAV